MSARDHSVLVTTNVIVNTLCKFWEKVLRVLSPGISPLASLTWHPDFQEAMKGSTFQVGVDKGLVQYGSLGKAKWIFSREYIEEIGRTKNFQFQ